jgi:hypothetical protein
MKRYGMSGICWAMLVVACASGGGSGDSETHFWTCASDLDCSASEQCVARRCTSTPVVGVAHPSNGPYSRADAGGGASGHPDAGANTGDSAGDAGIGATTTGGADGATNTGGAGGVSAGNAGAAGLGGTGAGGSLGAGGAGGSIPVADGGPSDSSLTDSHADAAPLAACNATGTTLLTFTEPDVDQIVLDGGYVYFHDGGGLWRVPRSGGTAEHLASMRLYSWPNQHAFALDDSSITWWDVGTSGDGSTVTNVNRLAKSAGPVTTLASLAADNDGSMAYFAGVVGPAGSVFVWSGPGALQPSLLQVRSDGTVAGWGRLPFYSNGAFFDGTNLFASGQNGVTINTFGFTAFANASMAREMVLDETTMYIGTGDTSGYVQVYSVPRNGGANSTLLWSGATSGLYLGNLAVDANYIYVAVRRASIVRMGKDGANPTEIVKGIPQEEIESVAVDENCIYWALEGSHAGPNRSRSGLYAAPR